MKGQPLARFAAAGALNFQGVIVINLYKRLQRLLRPRAVADKRFSN
jgi:hypothetical protein